MGFSHVGHPPDNIGANGEQVTEIGTGVWQHSNIWSGTGLTATYDPKGLHLHVTDPLGTRRVQLNAQGAVEGTCQNLPFGDALTCTPTALSTADDATEHHFTSKEYDAESGNDYFLARYYGSSMGRFLSPDPSGLYYANPGNPQSFNLYAYVLNNPLINVDPTGLDCVTDEGNGQVRYNTGDCPNESTDGANHEYYINCDGCTSGTAGAYLDRATGNLYATDANGNAIAGTTVQGFADPQGLLQTVNVTPQPDSDDDPDNPAPNSPAPNNTTQVPVHGLWTYGNYCGTGGMGTPINAMDAGCAAHDACYAQNGLTAGGNITGSNPALQSCNQALCNVAESVLAAQNHVGGDLDQANAALQINSYFHGFANIIRSGNRCR
jgi:RHS repeat-associated protein